MVMFLELIDKLIKEHGSSSILRDNLSFVKDQYLSLQTEAQKLEKRLETAQAETQAANAAAKACQLENARLRDECEKQRRQISDLEQSTAKSGNPFGYACDHCGSSALKQTGNRPDPTFGIMGVKQRIFTCRDCGKESAFTPD